MRNPIANLSRKDLEYDPYEVTPTPRATRVLLAEDDPDMRATLALVLRLDGYEVVEVEDGTDLEAVIRAATEGSFGMEPVDVVVSDVRMPGKNSLEVLRGLRHVDWVVPIVLITAFGSVEVHKEARRLGVREVLDKPLNLDHLRALLKSISPAA